MAGGKGPPAVRPKRCPPAGPTALLAACRASGRPETAEGEAPSTADAGSSSAGVDARLVLGSGLWGRLCATLHSLRQRGGGAQLSVQGLLSLTRLMLLVLKNLLILSGNQQSGMIFQSLRSSN